MKIVGLLGGMVAFSSVYFYNYYPAHPPNPEPRPVPVISLVSSKQSPEVIIPQHKPQELSDLYRKVNCLAKNVYFEARGEPIEGQRAVINVVLNRVNHDRYPDDICAVIEQGKDRKDGRCQFSWTCGRKSKEIKNQEVWIKIRRMAYVAISDGRIDNTRGSVFFHRIGVSPRWSRKAIKIKNIGSHIFYRDPHE